MPREFIHEQSPHLVPSVYLLQKFHITFIKIICGTESNE